MINRKKVLLVASQGGHWIQLKRVSIAFKEHKISYLSVTKRKPVFESNNGEEYFSVTDATRNFKIKLIKQFFQVAIVVIKQRPDIILTTGSSVGLMTLFWGRVFGATTIWIDSIANYEQLSMSGRLSRPFAKHHLTQWPHLAKGKTKYIESVL